MKLSQQVKPISYLKAHASEIINEICESQRPVIITQNGEARTIIQDLAEYERTQESMALLKILAQSRKNKEQGKYQTTAKAFKSIRKKIKES